MCSEKADYIEPILEDIRDLYGPPLAVIRDMGKGIAKGVDNVFEGAVVIICHFQFLRALGNRLFKYYHDKFRKNVDIVYDKNRRFYNMNYELYSRKYKKR